VQAAALADAVQVAIESKDDGRVAQSLKDIQEKYASTQQAGLAALAAAKAQADAGKLDEAKATLTWVSEKAGDDGHKAVARLRLAAVLMQQKDLDGAGKVLAGSFPAEFAGVQADRQGDLLQLQGKAEEAVQAYERAYKALDPQNEYRRLVEFKLNALGVQPQTMAAAGGTETAK
jgi:predicted negative regulator of RcsB-dependent stress response